MAPEKTDPETEAATSTTPANTSVASEDNDTHTDHDPYFEPVVSLPEIEVKTNEEDEEETVKLRCKLFRYNTLETPAEWKERGTGDVKILKHSRKKTLRILMRQDKTLKIRANHYITPFMELKPNCGSDRAWVWSVAADFADEEPKQELFAVRFANAENARLFKEKFDEARGIVTVAEVRGREEQSEGGTMGVSSATTTTPAASKPNEATSSSSSSPLSPSSEESPDSVAKDMEKLTVKVSSSSSEEKQ